MQPDSKPRKIKQHVNKEEIDLSHKRWWKLEDDKIHLSLIPYAKKLRDRNTYRHAQNLLYAKLYGNIDMLGFNSAIYGKADPISTNSGVKYNVIKSVINTKTAKIAKNKPRPRFLTEGGNWDKKIKAKNLTKFLDGSFYKAGVYKKSDLVYIDASVQGTGLFKVSPDFENMCVRNERVMIDEIDVDEVEAYYGEPRSIYQTKSYPREVLLSMFGDTPSHRMAIESLAQDEENLELSNENDSEMVPVIEAWHLKSSKTTKDGKHVIAIKGATLLSESWDWDRFPFAKYMTAPKQTGFFGEGVCERQVGKQVEINIILKNIQTAQRLGSNFSFMIEEGSGLKASQITNQQGSVYRYKGTKPEGVTFQTVNNEMYAHLERLDRKVFEDEGVSQMSAQSKKPVGLDSGVAIRETQDIESERFIKEQQYWDEFFLEVAHLHILCTKELAKHDPSYSVPTSNKKSIEYIKWSDAFLENEEFEMQCFPSSSLPREPGARMQRVQEMAQAQIIDPDTAIDLLDFPDLEEFRSTRLSKRDLVKQVLNNIAEKREYVAPEPTMDLTFALDYSGLFYNQCRMFGAPDDVLNDIDAWRAQVQDLLTPEPAAQAPAPMPGLPMPAMNEPMLNAGVPGMPMAA